MIKQEGYAIDKLLGSIKTLKDLDNKKIEENNITQKLEIICNRYGIFKNKDLIELIKETSDKSKINVFEVAYTILNAVVKEENNE